MITQAELKDLFDYSVHTGLFTRKINRGNTAKGDIAGTMSDGYIHISINNAPYKAHRLAWLYTYGVFPNNDIDHINRDRADNRLCNLRDATRSENMENQRKPRGNNKSGFLGVHFHKQSGMFRAQIKAGRKTYSIGLFKTAEEASLAYLVEKKNRHMIGVEAANG